MGSRGASPSSAEAEAEAALAAGAARETDGRVPPAREASSASAERAARARVHDSTDWKRPVGMLGLDATAREEEDDDGAGASAASTTVSMAGSGTFPRRSDTVASSPSAPSPSPSLASRAAFTQAPPMTCEGAARARGIGCAAARGVKRAPSLTDSSLRHPRRSVWSVATKKQVRRETRVDSTARVTRPLDQTKCSYGYFLPISTAVEISPSEQGHIFCTT